MDVILNIGENLVAAILGGVAVVLWRKWWNPPIWSFVYLRDNAWQLQRLGSRVTKVTISCFGEGPGDPILGWGSEQFGTLVVTDDMLWELETLNRGGELVYSNIVAGFTYVMHWYEGKNHYEALLVPRSQFREFITKRKRMKFFEKEWVDRLQPTIRDY